MEMGSRSRKAEKKEKGRGQHWELLHLNREGRPKLTQTCSHQNVFEKKQGSTAFHGSQGSQKQGAWLNKTAAQNQKQKL